MHRSNAFSTVFFAALMFAVGQAFAHAVVTESSLQHHPVLAGHPTQVQLAFNSSIELSLSKVFLVSSGDRHASLALQAGAHRGEILVSLPELGPGDYALRYKIFAADGHLTENIIHFVVGQKSE